MSTWSSASRLEPKVTITLGRLPHLRRDGLRSLQRDGVQHRQQRQPGNSPPNVYPLLSHPRSAARPRVRPPRRHQSFLSGGTPQYFEHLFYITHFSTHIDYC